MPTSRPPPIDIPPTRPHRSYSASSIISSFTATTSLSAPTTTSTSTSTSTSTPLLHTNSNDDHSPTTSISTSSSISTFSATSTSSPLRRSSTSTSISSRGFFRAHTHSSSISTPLSINLMLTTPTATQMWTLCRQTGYFYNIFIDTVTVPSLDTRRSKILMKNTMFAQAERALVIAREYAARTHAMISHYDLGQRRLKTGWAICDVASYDELFKLLDEKSESIFGRRLGRRIDYGEDYIPPWVPASQTLSDVRHAAIRKDAHEALMQSMQVNIDDWYATIRRYIKCFDAFRPLDAVRVMMEAAKELGIAARAVVRLIEHHYRLLLGLVPIEGEPEARKVYDMLRKGHEEDLVAELGKQLDRIEVEVEEDMWTLRVGNRDSGLESVAEANFEG